MCIVGAVWLVMGVCNDSVTSAISGRLVQDVGKEFSPTQSFAALLEHAKWNVQIKQMEEPSNTRIE